MSNRIYISASFSPAQLAEELMVSSNYPEILELIREINNAAGDSQFTAQLKELADELDDEWNEM